MTWGQNPKYFEDYLPEVRNILRFSHELQELGNLFLRTLNIPQYEYTCIHIRRTDFVWLGVSTNMNDTINAAQSIAKEKNISRFMIFGDDQGFMSQMAMKLSDGSQNVNATFVSSFTDGTDLYIASRACKSFLISAATSTFGWWLAFFTRFQNNVYYLADRRQHADKRPSKELFLYVSLLFEQKL
ncbi:hypothetical protein OESDEN_10340 [Oesophagostomum dentatum]|uniref:L-Fucosyltransferase n=1 Tax=Oesophagostomum dentatum TaxID=61180 RepID=A0A0B1T0Z9_OESDE|nr:hypothetical protein OESDEN_10340 [Oesophagostomum dentatum]